MENPRPLTKNFILGRTRLDSLRNVKNLNFWGQELNDVSILEEMPNVEVVSLSINNISSLKSFGCCPKLRELYLRKNKISEIFEVSFLKELKNLKVLMLSGNPCTESEDYRLKVISILDQLTKLDDDDITNEEKEAAKKYKYLGVGGGEGELLPPISKSRSNSPSHSPVDNSVLSAMLANNNIVEESNNKVEEGDVVVPSNKGRHKLARTPPKQRSKLNPPSFLQEQLQQQGKSSEQQQHSVVSNNNKESNSVLQSHQQKIEEVINVPSRRLHNDDTPIGGGAVRSKSPVISQQEYPPIQQQQQVNMENERNQQERLQQFIKEVPMFDNRPSTSQPYVNQQQAHLPYQQNQVYYNQHQQQYMEDQFVEPMNNFSRVSSQQNQRARWDNSPQLLNIPYYQQDSYVPQRRYSGANNNNNYLQQQQRQPIVIGSRKFSGC
ncbi:hypothetical protein ABK040_012472 [Willaertia magna]